MRGTAGQKCRSPRTVSESLCTSLLTFRQFTRCSPTRLCHCRCHSAFTSALLPRQRFHSWDNDMQWMAHAIWINHTSRNCKNTTMLPERAVQRPPVRGASHVITREDRMIQQLCFTVYVHSTTRLHKNVRTELVQLVLTQNG